MIEFSNMIDSIIQKARGRNVVVDSCTLFPVNKDMREMACFTTLNLARPESYLHGIEDHLNQICWYSPDAQCTYQKQHRNSKHPITTGAMNCSQCKFCLNDAGWYNIYFDVILSKNMSEKQIYKSLMPIIEKIDEKINAPINGISVKGFASGREVCSYKQYRKEGQDWNTFLKSLNSKEEL